MRKIVVAFIVLVFSYGISVKTIHADVGPPWAFFGSVVVSNREGAVGVYDGVVIPYGEVLEAGYMNGKIIKVKYGNDYISVNCEDIKPLEEYYYPEKEVDFENNYFECVVLNDVPALYKGPGLCYDKIDWMTIPKESIIRCDPSVVDPFWFYVSYEGLEGWLYLYEITEEEGLSNTPLIARVCNDEVGLLYDGTKIYYNASDYYDGNYFELKNYEDAFCNVTMKYRFNLGRSNDYFVVGDDFSGWVYQDNLWHINETGHNLYITSDNQKIYTDANLTEIKDTISCDGEYKLIYYKPGFTLESNCYDGAYIEYDDGKKGFIESNGDDVIAIWSEKWSEEYPIYNKNGICYLYSKPILEKENIIAEIPEGYRIKYQYHYNNGNDYSDWYHIDDNTYCGWVKGEELYNDINEKYVEEKKEERNESIEDDNITEPTIKKEEDTKHQNSFNIFDVVAFCLIVVFVTGTAIIIINKSKIKQIIEKRRKNNG